MGFFFLFFFLNKRTGKKLPYDEIREQTNDNDLHAYFFLPPSCSLHEM